MTASAQGPGRRSIQSTYDSRETGPRYNVTTRVNGRVIGEYEHPIDDPFVRQTVSIGWRDCLRALVGRSVEVVVRVSGNQQVINDVLELDANTLIAGSTRRREFDEELCPNYPETCGGCVECQTDSEHDGPCRCACLSTAHLEAMLCVPCYTTDPRNPPRVPAVLVVNGRSVCHRHARVRGEVWS